MESVKIRFYNDPETGEPHIHNHGVLEDEAVFSGQHHTLMEVPADLVPAIRELIARHEQHEDGEAR